MIIYVTTLHIKNEIQSSPSFLSSLRIAMRIASQDQVDATYTYLALLHDPGEFEDFLNEHKPELKSKANTNKINTHIIGPKNALRERVNKMDIAQKRAMNWTSNRITKL